METSEKTSLFAELTTEESTSICGGYITVKATYDPKTGKIEIESKNIELGGLGYGGFGYGGFGYGGLGHGGLGYGGWGYDSF